ncbi:MAG: hypothetical protein WC027_00235 [Candidatus Paceibacterota bacterium]
MKTFFKKRLIINLLSFVILFLPMFLFAAETIHNPLKSNDVNAILGDIMKLVATAGAIVVVFFIIYSGYKFVTARGNESEVTKAKDIFWATIIGGAILLGADVIATVVINTVRTTTGAQ